MTRELDRIIIAGAAEHNLKHIRVEIPKKRLVVFTGVSGSGKSSLAFDTLFAEGQRRYVESLSSYARQFLGQMEKPRYESIHGLTPTIAIDQRSAGSNPRSTVGTITEIHDYLRVLFARVGVQHCYGCGRPVSEQSAQQIIDDLKELPPGTKLVLLAPVVRGRKGEHREVFESLRRDGFLRARVDGDIRPLEDPPALDKKRKHTVEVVVDRLVAGPELGGRLSDSVETALRVGGGVLIAALGDGTERVYSEQNACQYCGISYPELSPQLFSFNGPQGMCKACNGLGTRLEMDPAKVIPDRSLSLADGAIAPWAGAMRNRAGWTWRTIETVCRHYGIPMDQPLDRLPPDKLHILLHGSSGERIEFHLKGKASEYRWQSQVEGILNTMARRLRETRSDEARSYYMKYFSDTVCPECGGERLRREARWVRIDGQSIIDMGRLPVGQLREVIDGLPLAGSRRQIARELVKEIAQRLHFLVNVGLDYLTLERAGPSLSGGEAQRIRLASQVGTELTGVTYILDEPSIGLHQRDNVRLISTLKHLRDLGNTVVVVEHDRETITAADHVIDFGPGAGIHGGEVVFAGTPAQLRRCRTSLTGQYLSGRREIPLPGQRRRADQGWLTVRGARLHNLQGIDAAFPLGALTFVTGVSGAGKSSLVNLTLYPALANRLNGAHLREGEHAGIEGLDLVDKVIDIDQKPIGRTPRSNPATYVKVFDLIREVFAQQKEARLYGYSSSRFSFNLKGGRCETCHGAGVIKVEMHFLADVYVPCDTCHGRRFNEATLKVHFAGASITDVLEMTIEEARRVFVNFPRIRRILDTLIDVGLGYVRLGQPSPTLSGGEAQRIKLARELSRAGTGRTVYILDEPTTGLHFEDVRKLLAVLQRLVDAGNTVIVIEHNLDAIRVADYVIDMGPAGGGGGGRIVAAGTPEEVAAHPTSSTGQHLRPMLGVRS
ncbi:MAG TPA: excinuclease ABC subunit UvrA [Acidobacteriota bacterium]|nr:excinuclease ABC subunit UvrA [Acidobacteriota bacterium]HQM63570.1 excinuclease ABC subunit UvrA [Acidobacteriota bacterium]